MAPFFCSTWALSFFFQAAAREGDALSAAVIERRAIDELGAVVAVEAGQGHGQSFADLVDAAAYARLALAPQGLQFDPAGGDIDGAEGEEEEAPGGATAMGDQIDLEEARARIVPLGEGTNGD